MHVDMPAANIDQLTWLDVRQHPLILRRSGLQLRPGQNNVTDGMQQGRRQGGHGSAKCEGVHGCSAQNQVLLAYR